MLIPRAEVQVAEYPPGARYGPRRLPDYEFVWVLRGQATWRIEDDREDGRPRVEEHVLRPGTLALGRMGTVDSYTWTTTQPSAHAYVHFSLTPDHDHDPDRDPEQLEVAPATRLMGPHDPLAGLCGYLLTLAGSADAAARARSDQVVGWLWDLFVRGPLPYTDGAAGVGEDAAVDVAVSRAVVWVRSQWETDGVRLVAVGELAAAAGLSAAHFSRLFAAEFGVGPAQALERVRLARAATALQRSNLTLREIAAVCGFSNQFHFSRRFAHTFGVPPGAFRNTLDGDPLAPVRHRRLLRLWHLLSPTAHAL